MVGGANEAAEANGGWARAVGGGAKDAAGPPSSHGGSELWTRWISGCIPHLFSVNFMCYNKMALRDTFVENGNVGSASSMSSREKGEKPNSAESTRTHLTSGSSVSARILQRAISESAFIHDATATIENVHVVTEFCGKVVNHPRVQVAIICLIIINAIMMGAATFEFVEENSTISNAFEITDLVFLIIFTVELGMQLIYYGYKLFLDGWLLFDFIIVVLSWALQSLQIIRAFRIFRALRLITRVKTMKNLVDALFDIMPRLGAVSALLSLIIYMYAVLCTELFGELELSQNYFGRLDHSIWTLLDMMTMDWGSVARECMHEIWWAWLPFCSFITITGFMVFNLVIAIVCDAVSALERKDALTGHIDIKGMLSGEISQDEIVSNNVKNQNSVSEKPENNEEEIIDYLEDRATNLSVSQKETQALLELLSLEIFSLQQQHSHLSEYDTGIVNERVVAGDPVSSINWIHQRSEENTDAL